MLQPGLGHSTADTYGRKIVICIQTNPMCWLSAVVTRIGVVASSTAATSISHTINFRWSQKKKFYEMRFGERGDKKEQV
ncbi:hypothetical protein TNCV_3575751 [Trichonephila clavipes]|nr:hypothetical protein TNCV_3575751 [Trichonephila clavipes]